MDRLEAVILIPETRAFSYAEGMRAEFRLLQNENRPYKGNLTSLDRAVEARTRTVTARIEIDNKDRLLKPGMVGRVRILGRTYSKAVMVPSSALLRLQNGIFAMIVENGVARQRIVKVGASTEEKTQILEGLKAGDLLIVSGAFQVSDGTKVSY
jgi:RND family efflux transporter MFP subunit